MSRFLARPTTVRLTVLAAAIAMIAAVACGTELASNSSAATTVPISAQGESAIDAAVPGGGSAGGIDEDCVARVLGREAAGFGDVTAAERDLIFQQCTGSVEDRRQRPLGGGFAGPGGFALNVDPECIQEVLGEDDPGATTTPEQRRQAFEECGGGEAPAFGGRAVGALDQECVQGVLGDQEGDFAQVTPEQRQQLVEECGGGTLPDSRLGGGGGGFFDPANIQVPECVSEALDGAEFTPGSLTLEQQQAIAESCGGQLGGGFGGSGGGFRGGQSGGGFFGGRGGTGNTP